MSLLAPDSPRLPSRALHGILCVEIGMLLFVAQDAMMKTMLESYPVWQLIFVRAVVSVLLLLPLVALLGRRTGCARPSGRCILRGPCCSRWGFRCSTRPSPIWGWPK